MKALFSFLMAVMFLYMTYYQIEIRTEQTWRSAPTLLLTVVLMGFFVALTIYYFQEEIM
jgi:hypothetical protein